MTKSLDSILSGASSAAITAGTNAPEPAASATPDAPAPQPEPTATSEPAAAASTVAAEPGKAGDAPATPEAPEPATVPLAALKEERGKVKRYTEQVASFEQKMVGLEQQNATLTRQVQDLITALRAPQQAPQNAPQPPAPPPDFFADPDAAVDARIKAALSSAIEPLTASQRQIAERMSRNFAIQSHGADKVQAAYAALDQHVGANPQAALADYQRIMGSPDPWGELVTWHQNQSALKEIGNDPAAYRERLKAELLEELKATQQPAPSAAAAQAQPAAPAASAPVVLPSNLAGARNAGTRSGPAYAGPDSIFDILNRAQKKTRAA